MTVYGVIARSVLTSYVKSIMRITKSALGNMRGVMVRKIESNYINAGD